MLTPDKTKERLKLLDDKRKKEKQAKYDKAKSELDSLAIGLALCLALSARKKKWYEF
jgi:hypothetical protein